MDYMGEYYTQYTGGYTRSLDYGIYIHVYVGRYGDA